MKIFIVEDEDVLLKVLQEKFEKEKFSVSTAINGEGVVEMVRRDRPDLILLDLILPKKNGFEVLTELKIDPELKDIPVIVLSNLGQDEDIKHAFSLGAVDYLVKAQHPLNEVVEKVNTYLLKGK